MFRRLKNPVVSLAAVAVSSVGVAVPSTAATSHNATDAARPTSAEADEATPWTPWEKAGKAPPHTFSGCSTKITLTEAVNKSEYRTRTDRDGNFLYQFRGTLHERINPKRGHTVVVDISGPGTLTFYPNHDVYFRARGSNLLTTSAKVYQASNPSRIPRHFLSRGRIAVFNDGNGTRRFGDDQSTVINRPDRYWNICPIVKTGVVPKPFRV